MSTFASTVRARVVAEHRGLLEIAGIPGISFGLPRGVFADADDPLSRPAVGDFVQVLPQVGSDVALIEAIEPRKSVFVRRQVGRRARVQVVAANVDTVFVVMGLDGDFNPRRVLRYQVAIADAGAEAVIVLNKCDLDPTGRQGDDLAGTVVRVSAASGLGLEQLAPWLGPGRTVAVVGSSGVGKSTLVNRLLGETRQATGGVRAGDDKGRHTTTHRALFELPGGAALIDTPGMRELGLVGEGDGLDEVFADVQDLVAGCRFRDCHHQGEPGCAVEAALRRGVLDADRWASYQKLQREAAFESQRHDEAAQRLAARALQKRFTEKIGRERDRRRLGWKA